MLQSGNGSAFSGFRVHGGSIPFCRNLRKSALLPLSTPLPRISYRLGKNRSASHQLLPFLTKSPDAIFCAPGSFSVHRKSSDSQRRRFIINIGIDHGYSAVKTRHFSFPAGISAYSYEPYTLQNTLEYGGQYFVCGTGRQPILRNKTENRNYYLLTLAAIAKEIRQRGEKTECSVTIGAGLPLTLFGREKKAFREYLLYPEKPEDSLSPVCFKFEGVPYRITVQDVKLFPQGYSALAVHPELLRDEPSVLLMDIGGWTVDLMRLDKGIPDASTCRSLELGMIRCVDEIREQVRRDTGLSLTDAQTERILSGKPCSLPEETRAIVRRQGRLYTERLFSAVTEAGFDCRALPVILMGGGASLVKKSVEPQDGLCRAIYLTDDKLNAEGFERILEQMSGEVKKV